MGKKKKIILFLGLGFLLSVLVCFVVLAVNKKEVMIENSDKEKTKDLKEDQNESVVERKKQKDNRKTNLDEKYEFKDPYFVSMEYVYKKTKMKLGANKEEVLNNNTNMSYVVNFYVLLSDVFEKEGFFNKINKELFLNKSIMGNDNSIRLNAETEFLIDGEENLKRFKDIVANKDFGAVEITKEKLKKATDEIFFYLEKQWKFLDKRIKDLNRILKLKNKDQVNKAKEYYNEELNELKKKKENGYIYTNGDMTQEVFLEKEIDSLNKQDFLTEEQIKDFKEELKSEQETYNVLNNLVIRGRPKNIKYESVKDLHKGIKVERKVKDMNDEMKYYGMGR